MYNPESVSTRGVHVKRDVVIIHFIQLHPPGVIKIINNDLFTVSTLLTLRKIA